MFARTALSRAGASFIPRSTQSFSKTTARTFVSSLEKHGAARPSLLSRNSSVLSSLQHVAPASKTDNVQRRNLFDWALRPYTGSLAAGSALSLKTLSAGFAPVKLSLFVMPWKALPTALVLLPAAYVGPAAFKLMFQNGSRPATAGLFTAFLHLTMMFAPVPCFENMFAEMTFYACMLFSTFFVYSFFPEIMLNEFMFFHYLVFFLLPVIPLGMVYMPMFATRNYLFI